MTLTPRTIAVQQIEKAIAEKRTAEHLLSKWTASVTPDDGNGSVWVNIAGGYLHPDQNKAQRLKVKKHQIGVAIYPKGQPSQYAIFDLQKLWDELTQPKQLAFWEME